MNFSMLFNGSSADPIFQFLLIVTLKTTVLLCIVQAVLLVLRGSSAALRHWLLTLGLTGIVLLPLLSSFSPSWSLPVLPDAATSGFMPSLNFKNTDALSEKLRVDSIKPVNPATSLVNTSDEFLKKAMIQSQSTDVNKSAQLGTDFHLPVATVLVMVWMLGVILIFARWLRQLVRVWRVTRRGYAADADWMNLLATQARFLKVKRRIRLLVSDEIAIPMTWGLWQPVILLPCDAHEWDGERRRVVLLHELAHIARRDYLTQWIVLVGCALNWFNPLVWKTARQALLEREQASDDLVLGAGVQNTDYAGHLLAIARNALYGRSFQMIGLAMAGRSDLERRIRGILNTRKNRRILLRTRSAAALGLLGLLLPLGGMQLSHASAQNGSTILTLAVDDGMQDDLRSSGVLNDFQTQHPDVTVKFAESARPSDAADSLDEHFTVMQAYANSADVLFFDGYNLSLAPHDTRAGYILDLAPLINSDATFQSDDFYPQMWSSFQWDNGVWAVPLGADMMVLNYDKTAFDQAGLAYPTGDWSWDNFVSMATLLTQHDKDGNVIVAGFGNSGRIFREGLWRSQIASDAVDASSLPNMPQFARSDIENIVGTYSQLEDQGVIGNHAAMFIDVARRQPDNNMGWALLPGNKTVLMPFGFAVSAGTQQPELAYELVKYLSAQPELSGGLTARKSLADVQGINRVVQPEYQSLIDQGFQNALTYSNLRFMDYLNDAWSYVSDRNLPFKTVLESAEAKAIADLNTADGKRGMLALSVMEPQAAVLASAEVALNFNLSTFMKPLPTQDQWDRVIQDFVAADPQVGAVNLQTVSESASDAAASSDCFYMQSNAVPSLPPNMVLPLDPLLSSDPNFDAADFFGSVLAAVQRDNKTYALPIDIQPYILRYNSARFAAANLPEPTNTWTIEQFTDSLRALQPSSQGQPPFTDTDSGGSYLLALIAAYGGLPLDYRTTPPTLNFTDTATVAGIQQVLDLARDGYIRYTALGNLGGGAFSGPDNTTAIYPSFLNGVGRKIAPGIVPDKPVLFPSGHDYTGLSYDIGTAYISAQSQNPEACYRFISTIAQHPELFSTMPARRSLLTNAAFQASTDPDILALYQQVETLLGDPQTVTFPISTKDGVGVSDFLFQHWLFGAFDSYVLNNGDLANALSDAQQMAQTYQTCAATLPILDLGGVNADNKSAMTPYVDCAEGADPSLKPVLDPLIGRG
ncbi:MAG: extracellular solute-binding protein [Chloroflexota bacterium]